MVRQAVLTILILFLPLVSHAETKCKKPDVRFTAFLNRFKDDAAFRETRIIFPLKTKSSGADGNAEQEINRERYIKDGLYLIRGNKEIAERKGTEGQVCESKPLIRGAIASLTQSSCGTDIYSDLYIFANMKGCWYLTEFKSSGS
jgi:hypothetical protein